ncbi:hypothetical protein GGI26_002775 [Coemansia sp. RSA 1358]|nr:hypothetical protein GGI26_002775 [Coemansia sp. RSA 1358]
MAASSIQQDITKRRIEDALSAFSTKRSRQNAQTTVSGTIPNASPSRSFSVNTGEGATEQPNTDKFRPWSREDLLARISTFKIHTWLVQAPSLSPVKCARNGWINVDCSTLKCSICNAILIAQIPDDLTDAEEIQWVGRLSEQLQTSHSVKCPWKGHECAEGMYSMPLETSRETVDDVCQYAADLLKFGRQLPVIESPLRTFQKNLLDDLKEKVLSMHHGSDTNISSASSESSQKPTDNDAVTALIFSLFGWRADASMPRAAVKCELCFRSAGLWLFQCVDVNPDERNTNEIPTNTSETNNDNNPHSFNVVDEHRSFCYWAHGYGQNARQDEGKSVGTAEQSNASLRPNSVAGSVIPGWQKVVASILRAKTMEQPEELSDSGSESSAEDSSDSDESESCSSSEEAVAATNSASNSDKKDKSDILKRFKPFNISAISSAAEAFGISFSTSLLAQAAKRLESLVSGKHGTTTESLALANNISSPGDRSKAATARTSVCRAEDAGAIVDADLAEWKSDTSVKFGIDDSSADVGGGSGMEDDDIPAPIDTSGLASLLGDSTLASALEDPAKAQAILNYVKGLLKAKNEEATSTAHGQQQQQQNASPSASSTS